MRRPAEGLVKFGTGCGMLVSRNGVRTALPGRTWKWGRSGGNVAGSAATREDRRRNRGPKRFIVGAVALIIGGLLTAGALGDVAPITFTGSSASSDGPAATDTSSAPSDTNASLTDTST